jgi:hypothetical protein
MSRVLTIQVTAPTGDAAPTSGDLAMWQQFSQSIATKLVAALGSS